MTTPLRRSLQDFKLAASGGAGSQYDDEDATASMRAARSVLSDYLNVSKRQAQSPAVHSSPAAGDLAVTERRVQFAGDRAQSPYFRIGEGSFADAGNSTYDHLGDSQRVKRTEAGATRSAVHRALQKAAKAVADSDGEGDSSVSPYEPLQGGSLVGLRAKGMKDAAALSPLAKRFGVSSRRPFDDGSSHFNARADPIGEALDTSGFHRRAALSSSDLAASAPNPVKPAITRQSSQRQFYDTAIGAFSPDTPGSGVQSGRFSASDRKIRDLQEKLEIAEHERDEFAKRFKKMAAQTKDTTADTTVALDAARGEARLKDMRLSSLQDKYDKVLIESESETSRRVQAESRVSSIERELHDLQSRSSREIESLRNSLLQTERSVGDQITRALKEQSAELEAKYLLKESEVTSKYDKHISQLEAQLEDARLRLSHSSEESRIKEKQAIESAVADAAHESSMRHRQHLQDLREQLQSRFDVERSRLSKEIDALRAENARIRSSSGGKSTPLANNAAENQLNSDEASKLIQDIRSDAEATLARQAQQAAEQIQELKNQLQEARSYAQEKSLSAHLHIRTAHVHDIEKMSLENQQLQHKIDSLESELSNYQTLSSKLQSQIEDKSNQLDKQSLELNELQILKSELQTKLQMQERSLQLKLTESTADMQQEHSEKLMDMQTKQQGIERDLRLENQKLNLRIEDLKAQLEVARDQVESTTDLTKRLASSEKELDRVREEMQAANIRNVNDLTSNFNKEIAELRQFYEKSLAESHRAHEKELMDKSPLRSSNCTGIGAAVPAIRMLYREIQRVREMHSRNRIATHEVLEQYRASFVQGWRDVQNKLQHAMYLSGAASKVQHDTSVVEITEKVRQEMRGAAEQKMRKFVLQRLLEELKPQSVSMIRQYLQESGQIVPADFETRMLASLSALTHGFQPAGKTTAMPAEESVQSSAQAGANFHDHDQHSNNHPGEAYMPFKTQPKSVRFSSMAGQSSPSPSSKIPQQNMHLSPSQETASLMSSSGIRRSQNTTSTPHSRSQFEQNSLDENIQNRSLQSSSFVEGSDTLSLLTANIGQDAEALAKQIISNAQHSATETGRPQTSPASGQKQVSFNSNSFSGSSSSPQLQNYQAVPPPEVFPERVQQSSPLNGQENLADDSQSHFSLNSSMMTSLNSVQLTSNQEAMIEARRIVQQDFGSFSWVFLPVNSSDKVGLQLLEEEGNALIWSRKPAYRPRTSGTEESKRILSMCSVLYDLWEQCQVSHAWRLECLASFEKMSDGQAAKAIEHELQRLNELMRKAARVINAVSDLEAVKRRWAQHSNSVANLKQQLNTLRDPRQGAARSRVNALLRKHAAAKVQAIADKKKLQLSVHSAVMQWMSMHGKPVLWRGIDYSHIMNRMEHLEKQKLKQKQAEKVQSRVQRML